jgi:hypothetical protein
MEIFVDYAVWDETAVEVEEEKSKNVVEALHKISRSFLLDG